MESIKTKFIKELPFFMAVPAVIWQILFFYIPLFFILCLSFMRWEHSSICLTSQYYTSLFDLIYVKIILRSVVLGLTVAFLCLLIGYPVAYFAAVKKRSWRNVILSFLIFPFWTNLLVHVYAWNFVLEKDGLINAVLLKLHIIGEPLHMLNNIYAVVFVMFYCYLPFMIMPLISILEKFDKTLIEASMDLGANTRQTLYKVILPLSIPGIRTGFFLVFVPAFGEFVIPLLMGGDKYMFVGNLITHYFIIGNDIATGAAFTAISSFVLLMVILFVSWYMRTTLKQEKVSVL